MSKKNFYAVKAGRKTGIFTKWSECLESVSGYPRAQYKGFSTKEDAEAYMNDLIIKEKTVADVVKSIHESEDDKVIYYAVKNGRKNGLYSTWEQCREQINGYSGAEYKKVQGKIAALKYINPDLIVKRDKIEGKNSLEKLKCSENEQEEYYIEQIKFNIYDGLFGVTSVSC